jgi:homocysteine S-methyltransferase
MIFSDPFTITVEVVPPAGPDPEHILAQLESLHTLSVQAYNVATNPVAKPRLSALALSALIQKRTGQPAILHCTTRDHNRLSLQSLLWGARALGVNKVLITTGDYISMGDQAATSTVRDVNVFELVDMARATGLQTGVVFDPFSSSRGREHALRRLERKVEAGAQFVITQPVYDQAEVEAISNLTQSVDIPLLLGILPLRSPKHALFLHHKVSGIVIPDAVLRRMEAASAPLREGAALARAVLQIARDHVDGACLMPPFDDFSILPNILEKR